MYNIEILILCWCLFSYYINQIIILLKNGRCKKWVLGTKTWKNRYTSWTRIQTLKNITTNCVCTYESVMQYTGVKFEHDKSSPQKSGKNNRLHKGLLWETKQFKKYPILIINNISNKIQNFIICNQLQRTASEQD